MSNIFKQNSRFSFLKDEIVHNNEKKEQEKQIVNKSEKEESFNSFKSNRPLEMRNSIFRPYDEKERNRINKERDTLLKEKKELERQEKERMQSQLLTMNKKNFPDLVVNVKNDDVTQRQTISYLDKFKKEEFKESENINEDLEKLKPGWVLLKRDSVTGRTIIKSHPENNEMQEKNVEQKIVYDISKPLAKLYQRRTDEYIEQYGYDEWERMFKFPDWREREAYLEQMDELANMSYEEESEEDDYYQ
jgi:hypothetical protein